MLISNIFIPNTLLRKQFQKQVDAVGISQLNALGLVATQAAYEKGGEWYEAMHEYVKENIEFAKEYVKDNLPGVNMIDTEGTYLIWLDFRNSSIDIKDLDDKIIYEAKLWLDSGKIFGHTGEGFERINVACPRSILKEALDRLADLLSTGKADNIIRFRSEYDVLVAQG